MDFDELLKYLDIEDPAEFIYFETMADLVESERYIDREAVHALFEGAHMETVGGLFEDYFEDILEGLPDDSSEIYDLLHQIKLSLKGMAVNCEDEGDLGRLVDGFCRFRDWYTADSLVELTSDEDDEIIRHTLMDAITASRMENLGGKIYSYDFTGAMDFPLDSYEISLASLMAAEDVDEEEAYVPDDWEGNENEEGRHLN